MDHGGVADSFPLPADVIWSIFVVVGSSALSENAECSIPLLDYHLNIWWFCAAAVIVMPLFASAVGIIRSTFQESDAGHAVQHVPGFLSLLLAIWGFLLWYHLTPECEALYGVDNGSLLIVFKINVVMLAVGFIFNICLVCLLVAGLSSMMGSAMGGAPDRYESIPDSLPVGRGATEDYV